MNLVSPPYLVGVPFKSNLLLCNIVRGLLFTNKSRAPRLLFIFGDSSSLSLVCLGVFIRTNGTRILFVASVESFIINGA